MDRRSVLTSGAVAVGLGGIGYAALRFLRFGDERHCAACQRHVHVQMRTVAMVGGRKEAFCCPACAFSERRQRNQTVDVLTVTDAATGKELDAKSATMIVGSDVNMCHEMHPTLDGGHQPLADTFDRCSPSMIAFGGIGEARDFQRRHGGEIIGFSSLAARRG